MMSSHNHCSSFGCEHNNLKYCKCCRVPYCVDCGYEWKTYSYWNYPYYTYTYTAGQLQQSPTVVSSGNANTPESLTGCTVTCKHEG